MTVMVDLIPMALIAMFGYLVYRWSAATNRAIRQASPNQRGPKEKSGRILPSHG